MSDDASDLIFRQLRMGPMANFIYLIGSRRTRECLLVDPAWEVDALLDLVARDELKLVGVLATHAHPDHVGGEVFGMSVIGVPQLLEQAAVPIHANRHEAEFIKLVTGVSDSDLALHDSGDVIAVGDVDVRLLHTPGHTPGSQCFLLQDRLVSGDTLFIQGCGRVDLPGSDPDQMYESLTQKLAKLPPGTVLYPGHDYADRPSSTIGDALRSNQCLQVRSLDDWRMLMGTGRRGYS